LQTKKRREPGSSHRLQNVPDGLPFAVPQIGEKGKMPKCDLSLDRLETGLTPAWMNVYPGKALHAGSMDELSSGQFQ
jgi:Fe-S-cluster-containing dehydrogenase component